jgi:hypothetical protein
MLAKGKQCWKSDPGSMSGQYKTVLAALQINTYHVEEKVRTRRTTESE